MQSEGMGGKAIAWARQKQSLSGQRMMITSPAKRCKENIHEEGTILCDDTTAGADMGGQSRQIQ